MKKIKVISATVILTILFACEARVTFNEPQPANVENLLKFPQRLQGEYLSLENGSILTIDNKLIQRIYDFDYKIHPSEIDSTSIINGDTLIDITTNEKTIIRYDDSDSLIIHVHYIDTLFQMNYDNVVRKFKGYLFLNIRYGKESWEVKKMQLEKGKLVIGRISTKDEIEKLKEITETLEDTAPPYNFTATKKQFGQFIKKDGFSNNETFIKQK